MSLSNINIDFEIIKEIRSKFSNLKNISKKENTKFSVKWAAITSAIAILTSNFYTETPMDIFIGGGLIFLFVFFSMKFSISINLSFFSSFFNKNYKEKFGKFHIKDSVVYDNKELKEIEKLIEGLSETGKETLYSLISFTNKNLDIENFKKHYIKNLITNKIETEDLDIYLKTSNCNETNYLVLKKHINDLDINLFIKRTKIITNLVFSNIEESNQEGLLCLIKERLSHHKHKEEEKEFIIIKNEKRKNKIMKEVSDLSDFYEGSKRKTVIKEI
jgi:hypothetical protein